MVVTIDPQICSSSFQSHALLSFLLKCLGPKKHPICLFSGVQSSAPNKSVRFVKVSHKVTVPAYALLDTQHIPGAPEIPVGKGNLSVDITKWVIVNAICQGLLFTELTWAHGFSIGSLAMGWRQPEAGLRAHCKLAQMLSSFAGGEDSDSGEEQARRDHGEGTNELQ